MPNYRRSYVPGGTYFFTIVTHQRRKIFDTPRKLELLYGTLRRVQINKPFELIAYCLLPDHLHLLIKLPDEDSDFSIRIREIKRLTTIWIRREPSENVDQIWQDKFWEHTIRDGKDLLRHFDYIHYNPVKHNLTDSFDGWKWSSFRDFYHGNAKDYEILDPDRLNAHQGEFGE